MSVILQGKWDGRKCYSLAEDIRIPNEPKTHDLAAKRLPRVFVDLGCKTHVMSMEGEEYSMTFRGVLSHCAWMYFAAQTLDVANA